MPYYYETNSSKKIEFFKRGRKTIGLFFMILGTLFQILFIWMYWSFVDSTGQFSFIWLTIIYSDLIPFIPILFMFGGGCFLIAMKEFFWLEGWCLEDGQFTLYWQFFILKKEKFVPFSQIKKIRINKIPIDKIGIFSQRRLEIDYLEPNQESVVTVTLFIEESSDTTSTCYILERKAKQILDLDKSKVTE
ncbi:MAG: hypothetical protein ACXADY_26835 [Candidatus Hodarchaeales archaeon]|jgi:hypothetical protein